MAATPDIDALVLEGQRLRQVNPRALLRHAELLQRAAGDNVLTGGYAEVFAAWGLLAHGERPAAELALARARTLMAHSGDLEGQLMCRGLQADLFIRDGRLARSARDRARDAGAARGHAVGVGALPCTRPAHHRPGAPGRARRGPACALRNAGDGAAQQRAGAAGECARRRRRAAVESVEPGRCHHALRRGLGAVRAHRLAWRRATGGRQPPRRAERPRPPRRGGGDGRGPDRTRTAVPEPASRRPARPVCAGTGARGALRAGAGAARTGARRRAARRGRVVGLGLDPGDRVQPHRPAVRRAETAGAVRAR